MLVLFKLISVVLLFLLSGCGLKMGCLIVCWRCIVVIWRVLYVGWLCVGVFWKLYGVRICWFIMVLFWWWCVCWCGGSFCFVVIMGFLFVSWWILMILFV